MFTINPLVISNSVINTELIHFKTHSYEKHETSLKCQVYIKYVKRAHIQKTFLCFIEHAWAFMRYQI
jgi:hypothetical protein